MPRTLIHNDFNPRNLCLRQTDGGLRLCAYDWELATLQVPQHDLAELLCFVLPPDVEQGRGRRVRRAAPPRARAGERRRARPDRAGGAATRCRCAIWRSTAFGQYLMGHTFRHYGFVERTVPHPVAPLGAGGGAVSAIADDARPAGELAERRSRAASTPGWRSAFRSPTGSCSCVVYASALLLGRHAGGGARRARARRSRSASPPPSASSSCCASSTSTRTTRSTAACTPSGCCQRGLITLRHLEGASARSPSRCSSRVSAAHGGERRRCAGSW